MSTPPKPTDRSGLWIARITSPLFMLGLAFTMLVEGFYAGHLVIAQKEVLGYVATGLCVAGLGYLLIETWLGNNSPHLFAWIAWTLVDFVAWYNSMTNGGGAGAWSLLALTILTALITAAIVRQWRNGVADYDFGMFDLACVIGGVASFGLMTVLQLGLFPGLVATLTRSLPPAVAGSLSIIAATITEAFATGYTIKNLRQNPYAETRVNYSFNIPRHLVSLFALGAYSFTTLVFPISLFFMNSLTVAAIWWYRRSGPPTA
ncbi:MAG: hypothetical protein JWN01_1239 [Patescibacteria group bacterium]|nr:hypothetical protein [Patescibacteria group bacterium]